MTRPVVCAAFPPQKFYRRANGRNGDAMAVNEARRTWLAQNMRRLPFSLSLSRGESRESRNRMVTRPFSRSCKSASEPERREVVLGISLANFFSQFFICKNFHFHAFQLQRYVTLNTQKGHFKEGFRLFGI